MKRPLRDIEGRCEDSNVLLTRVLEEGNRRTGREVPFETITWQFSRTEEKS